MNNDPKNGNEPAKGPDHSKAERATVRCKLTIRVIKQAITQFPCPHCNATITVVGDDDPRAFDQVFVRKQAMNCECDRCMGPLTMQAALLSRATQLPKATQ